MSRKKLNAAKEEYSSFERSDIQLREDLKALKAQLKKLQKSAEREAQRAETAAEDLDTHNENIAKAEEACKKLEKTVKKAEALLEKVHHDIRETTAPIRQKLEEKQKDLLPYTDTVNKCTQDLEVAKMELKLLLEKRDAPAKQLAAEESTLETLRGDLQIAESAAKSLSEDRTGCHAALRELAVREAGAEKELQAKMAQVAQVRGKVAEAREASQASSSRNRVQAGLHAASRDGRILASWAGLATSLPSTPSTTSRSAPRSARGWTISSCAPRRRRKRAFTC